MATYPGSLFVPTVVADDPGGTEILATHHNTQDDEILAIETELGTDVAGSAATLKARLAMAIGDDGTLELNASTVLTISSGAITVTQNWHRVATEGAAASDDLATINGLAVDGKILFLRPSTSNDVVIKHNTGNIYCVSGADFSMADTNEFAILIYDANLSKWLAGRMATSGAVSTSTGAADNYIAVYTAASNVEGKSALQFDYSLMMTDFGDTSATDFVMQFYGGGLNYGYFQWESDNDRFYFNDDLKIAESESLILGSLDYASLTYDGTNLVIKPDGSGSGKVVISSALAAALEIGAGTAGIDYNITFNGETNDGVLTWMEDEDYFQFADVVKTAGRIRAVTTKTTTYVLTAANEVVVCNSTTPFTVTLPAATGSGRVYDVKNINTGAVTLDGDGADTIDSLASQTLNQWDSITVCDYAANAWVII